ncbi:MAG TPA: glucosamine-6-phosphate deaminase, partial [Microbacterium sp.]|nr:glucosamine-6-phosphate deaminase [Microbacterium sp.]
MAEVIIVPGREAGGKLVASEIARRIRATPDLVLGLATGSTPLPVYQALVPALAGVDVS